MFKKIALLLVVVAAVDFGEGGGWVKCGNYKAPYCSICPPSSCNSDCEWRDNTCVNKGEDSLEVTDPGKPSTEDSLEVNPTEQPDVLKPYCRLDRIVGGNIVRPCYKYPFIAFFWANGYMCGGSIITKRHVLSAMHCLFDEHGNKHPARKTSVIVGEHNIDDGVNEGGQEIRVLEYIEHGDYNRNAFGHLDNDIVILHLSKDIIFNKHVAPVNLPCRKSFAEQSAKVIGWGRVGERFGGTSYSRLKETTVDVMDPADPRCRRFIVDGNKRGRICAYEEGTDSCQGDSGGPLFVEENGKFIVIGVISYGAGCARKDNPGIYANVYHYVDWIKQKVEAEKLQLSC